MLAFQAPKHRKECWKKWESILPPTCHSLIPHRDGRLEGQSYSRLVRTTFKGQKLRSLGRLLKAASRRQHSYNHINGKEKSRKYFKATGSPLKIKSSRTIQPLSLDAGTVISSYFKELLESVGFVQHPTQAHTDED